MQAQEAPGAGRKRGAVRDFLLNEALKRLATEAATRFSALVASGDQIPFDVAAEDGDESAFYRYVPLTARYVEERAEELRSLPTFGPAREAAVEAGVAAALPGGARRVGAGRPGRARRADADDLHRLALGGLHRVLPRPRAPRRAPSPCSTPKRATPTTPRS